MSDEFKLPEGLAPEVAEMFAKPEVLEVVKGMINGHVTGLLAKNRDLLDKHSVYKKSIDDLGGLDTIKTRLSSVEQAEQARQQAALQVEAASNDVESVRKSMQQMLADKDAKLEAYAKRDVNYQVDKKLSALAKKHDADLEMLTPFLSPRTKTVTDEAGNVSIKVFNADGTPMLKGNMEDATVDDLFVEYSNHPKYGQFFGATNRSGSGAKASAITGSQVDNPFMTGTPAFNLTKQSELLRNNPQLANMLASQANYKLS